jgi:hypothetical protein
MYVILLTACINPDGMLLTQLTDPEIRKSQYVEALRFYLGQTDYPIVFVENSGNDISHLFQSEITSGKLEMITFEGNMNKTKGKGFGECEIIEHALDHSQVIKNCLAECNENHTKLMVMKITGRLIIKNFRALIKGRFPFQHHEDLVCELNTGKSFAASQVFISSCEVLRDIVDNKECLDDNKGVWFEHLLARVAFQRKCRYFPFSVKPDIQGIAGSAGKPYTVNRTLKSKLEYQNAMYYEVSRYYQDVAPAQCTPLQRVVYKVTSYFYQLIYKSFINK